MKLNDLFRSSLVVLMATHLLAACTAAPSSNRYSTTQAGTLQEVQFGTVLAVRPVMIEQNSSETGQVAGGIIGGVAGSEVGQGKGQIVGSVAGAVAGSAIGSIIDRASDAKQGLEITVKLQNERIVALAQIADEMFQVGDNVKILSSNGKSRVVH
ncbi:glycine zipper 2TM domain-containing protein [Thiothrix eikelboomii]|uniref:glycine zipper 2TM domain-containing protein n=1 Tax=Thiothrix eikelboomii TaxID=92487 RepID=UPI003BAF0071